MATVAVDNGSKEFQTRNAMVKHEHALFAFVKENEEKFVSYDKLKPEEKQKLLTDFKTAAGVTQNVELVVNVMKGERENYAISASLVDSSGNQLSTVTLYSRTDCYTAEAFQLNAAVDRDFKTKMTKFANDNLSDIRKASKKASFIIDAPGIDAMRRHSLDEKLDAIFGEARIDNIFTTTDGRTGIRGYVWNQKKNENGANGYFELYVDSKGKVTSLIEPPNSKIADEKLKLGDLPASFRNGKAIFTTNSEIDVNKDGLLSRDEIIKSDKPSLSPPPFLDKEVAAKNAANITAIFHSLPPAAQSKVLSAYQGYQIDLDFKKLPNSAVEPLARQFVSEGNLHQLRKLLSSRPEAEEVRLVRLFAKEIVSMERQARD